jgi:hypothetical protein
VARWLAAIVPHLRIAHQVGGRVRLKLDAAAASAPVVRDGGGARLQRFFGALPGVRSIAFNPLARSCVVEYDSAVIPDAAWPDLLAGRSSAAAAALLGPIVQAVSAAVSSDRKETP